MCDRWVLCWVIASVTQVSRAFRFVFVFSLSTWATERPYHHPLPKMTMATNVIPDNNASMSSPLQSIPSVRLLGRPRGARGGHGGKSNDGQVTRADYVPVVVGLVGFTLMCLGMAVYFGRKRLREYCKSRHQTSPTSGSTIWTHTPEGLVEVPLEPQRPAR